MLAHTLLILCHVVYKNVNEWPTSWAYCARKKKVNKNLVSLAGLLDRFRRIMGTGLWFIMIWSWSDPVKPVFLSAKCILCSFIKMLKSSGHLHEIQLNKCTIVLVLVRINEWIIPLAVSCEFPAVCCCYIIWPLDGSQVPLQMFYIVYYVHAG